MPGRWASLDVGEWASSPELSRRVMPTLESLGSRQSFCDERENLETARLVYDCHSTSACHQTTRARVGLSFRAGPFDKQPSAPVLACLPRVPVGCEVLLRPFYLWHVSQATQWKSAKPCSDFQNINTRGRLCDHRPGRGWKVQSCANGGIPAGGRAPAGGRGPVAHFCS